ncbi:MAG TPA: amidohydrolase [Gemmatimonadaceae bacterium]|nr:amidohydrolase [Gemmatimonadaceae bacterium]
MRILVLALIIPTALQAQASAVTSLRQEIERRANEIQPKVVAWRRDIHQHPELSFQETRTAALVAEHLRKLGLEVQTGVGGNGVVGILRGGRPGPVVALRADMDALPVTEQVDLPFKSTVRAQYRGQEVGVMHACGHDNHVAILMGTAEVLTAMKSRLPGTVKFLFQPAEESGTTGGAGPMIDAGALDNPKVDAVFGLHVGPGPLGQITYKSGPAMASSDGFRIVVHGKQTHGAMPYAGVDPIVVGSQIVLALQTIVSRQVNLSAAPAILTVGAFNGGNRENIIPDSAVLIGTIRTFDENVRNEIHERLKRTAESIAASAGATADVRVDLGYPVTVNDPALATRMLPTLQRAAGANMVATTVGSTASEDFSRFAQKAPGLFVFLGVTSPSQDWRTAASNHSPLFQADEDALPVGVKVMSELAVDYLSGGK